MTDNKVLPNTTRVVRYAGPSHVIRSNSKEKIKASAFFRMKPNPTNESSPPIIDDPSFNRLENSNTSKEEQLARARKFIKLELKENGRIAELCVGETMNAISRAVDIRKYGIKFVSAPRLHNPLHCEIVGLPPPKSCDEDLFADIIAETVMDIHPAVINP